MKVYLQQLAAQTEPRYLAIANLLISQHKQNLSAQQQFHDNHQQSQQLHQQIIYQMTQIHDHELHDTNERHTRELNALVEFQIGQRLQADSMYRTSNGIPPIYIQQFIQQQQEQHRLQLYDQRRNQCEEIRRLNNNYTRQMLDATTQQHNLQRQYEVQQSSTLPPLGYGEAHPHASPLGPSGYLNTLRNITAGQVNKLLTRYGRLEDDAAPGLDETKPGVCCLLFGCKINANGTGGQLFCYSHKSLLFPMSTGHNLLGAEVNFRGPALALGSKLVLDGATCGFKPDMSRVTDTVVDVYENDPPDHATSLYTFQVGRDKCIFEWVHRVSGKNIRQLRWLHRNRKDNTIPEDIIIWFILLVHYTDFMGATGDIIALVSIGKASSLWQTKIEQYASTFRGIVVGYELHVSDDGTFSYKVIDYCSWLNLSPESRKFGKYYPPLHGKDECCANYLESCHFSVQCLVAMLVSVPFPTEDSDENIVMDFDSIFYVLDIRIDIDIQVFIDEICRRMRRIASSREISFTARSKYYSKSSASFWEEALSEFIITESNAADDGVFEGNSSSCNYTFDDIGFLTEAVRVIKRYPNGISNRTDLRDILYVLYPSTLKESAVFLELRVGPIDDTEYVFMRNEVTEQEDEEQVDEVVRVVRSDNMGKMLETDDIVAKILRFLPIYDEQLMRRYETIVALELGGWKASIPSHTPVSPQVNTRRRKEGPSIPLEWSAYPDRLVNNNILRVQVSEERQKYHIDSNAVVTKVLEFLVFPDDVNKRFSRY